MTFKHYSYRERKYETQEEFIQAAKERYSKLSEEEYAALCAQRKETINRPEVKNKIRNALTGYRYWNNGIEEVRSRDKPEGEDWIKGRLPSKKNLHLKGTHYWNNGLIEIRTKEQPGEGFIRGRLPEYKPKPFNKKFKK